MVERLKFWLAVLPAAAIIVSVFAVADVLGFVRWPDRSRSGANYE
tara:strand:- start:384 stop:518 length:135 start_codon:yes stop_codon:yes gene_type:complete